MILINENLRIKSDANNWIVEENNPIKDKESKNYGLDNWTACGYFGRVSSAIEKAYDIKLKELPDMGIVEFIREAKKIKSELKKVLEEV